MKIIELSNGLKCKVDNKDFEVLNQWRWGFTPSLSGSGYASRRKYLGGGKNNAKYEKIFMHKIIVVARMGMQVDHINGDKLDNRRSNLRECTAIENSKNRKIYKNNNSGYKGVHKHGKFWRARITVNGKKISLGLFNDPKVASKAYEASAKKYFKDFARINTARREYI